MTEYIKDSISKGDKAESAANAALSNPASKRPGSKELKHGAWIVKARSDLKLKRFSTPVFILLIVFVLLYVGSLYLFENMDIVSGPLYAAKISIGSLFAISLGFILSVWWSSAARFQFKLDEAERIDREYRELLISFSDSLFDIINALNTLASKPPRPFVIATEFMLGEYVHLLQSQLQRYGDYIAGLGLDASDFLDEKIRIFEGIRERASLSIKGMPKELESLLIDNLNLDSEKFSDFSAQHQEKMREKLKELSGQETDETKP